MAPIDRAKPATKANKYAGRKPNPSTAAAKPPFGKRDQLRARLEQSGGASLKQLEQEFGWQPHTVRAAISGLRKSGLEVLRECTDTASVYRIVASKVA